ncbi:hypothetical protein XELAEV_18008015mg [Xenopus laevis]|uniref:GIY-YIG domain-containing protein n=1 Tax=Xenopus laevis TaxID=8355 RepID=A0A974E297_XENLA|nr:hypothetical protein XELAEV_18008015mg [Xenopus laevis]
MDRNNLLHRKSFHNPQTLDVIPKGQYMKAKMIASTETGYKKRNSDNDKLTFVSKYDKHSKVVEKIVKKYWPLLQTDATYGSTFFVIYVLKCPCGMLFVGKTIRPVNIRIKKHKNTIRNFKEDTYTDTNVSMHSDTAKHNV